MYYMYILHFISKREVPIEGCSKFKSPETRQIQERLVKLIGKSHRPQNKTFIRGASPGVSDELWDKNVIGGRGWDVATQERKVCNMEIEIVTFVVKESTKLTVPTDWQEQNNREYDILFCNFSFVR